MQISRVLCIILLGTVSVAAQTKKPISRKGLDTGPRATAEKPKPVKVEDIETDYDKFEDKTSVSTRTIRPSEEFFLSADFSYAGQVRGSAPERIRLLFMTFPSNWPTTTVGPPLKLLVNGSRFEFGPNENLRFVGSIPSGDVTMRAYAIDVELTEFRSLACGKSLSMKFGFAEADWKVSDLVALESLLKTAGGTCASQ